MTFESNGVGIPATKEHRSSKAVSLVIYDFEMPAQKPETALRKKLEALERHKAMMDGFGTFLKAHPDIAAECSVYQLHGKLGLKFDEYALLVPYLKRGN